MDKLKTCTKCKKELPATKEYFHSQKKGKYGVRSHCKKCHYKCNIDYNSKNKQKVTEYNRNYYKDNYVKLKTTPEGREVIRKRRIKDKRSQRARLTDQYIITTLINKTGLPYSDIKKRTNLIEIQRQILKIKRYAKEN